MAQVANVRVENMIYTVKELQNEKVVLEQKLQELSFKGRDLEQKLEQEITKCAHIQDKHRRMAGTFAVAQQKVETTMTSCVGLQEDLDRKKPDVNRIQENIENEKKRQQNNIATFQTSLSSISNELFHARHFYKTPTLHAEIDTANKAFKDLELKAERDQRELQRMQTKLEQLIRDEQKCVASAYRCEGALYTCYRALERDREEAETYRNRVKSELNEIRAIIS